MNKCVFGQDYLYCQLKCKSLGRSFHNLGAASIKDLSPIVFFPLTGGTLRILLLLVCNEYVEDLMLTRSDRYSGAKPFIALNVINSTGMSINTPSNRQPM